MRCLSFQHSQEGKGNFIDERNPPDVTKPEEASDGRLLDGI